MLQAKWRNLSTRILSLCMHAGKFNQGRLFFWCILYLYFKLFIEYFCQLCGNQDCIHLPSLKFNCKRHWTFFVAVIEPSCSDMLSYYTAWVSHVYNIGKRFWFCVLCHNLCIICVYIMIMKTIEPVFPTVYKLVCTILLGWWL